MKSFQEMTKEELTEEKKQKLSPNLLAEKKHT